MKPVAQYYCKFWILKEIFTKGSEHTPGRWYSGEESWLVNQEMGVLGLKLPLTPCQSLSLCGWVRSVDWVLREALPFFKLGSCQLWAPSFIFPLILAEVWLLPEPHCNSSQHIPVACQVPFSRTDWRIYSPKMRKYTAHIEQKGNVCWEDLW